MRTPRCSPRPTPTSDRRLAISARPWTRPISSSLQVLQLDRTSSGLRGNGFPILFRRLQERLQLFFRDTDATLPLADPIATEPAVANRGIDQAGGGVDLRSSFSDLHHGPPNCGNSLPP